MCQILMYTSSTSLLISLWSIVTRSSKSKMIFPKELRLRSQQMLGRTTSSHLLTVEPEIVSVNATSNSSKTRKMLNLLEKMAQKNYTLFSSEIDSSIKSYSHHIFNLNFTKSIDPKDFVSVSHVFDQLLSL